MSCHGLKMAYRNLLKYKLQSVICVLGLAGGLSCFTVCNYMLRKELAWNKQLPHYGETYKLVTIRENGEVDGLVSLDLAEQFFQRRAGVSCQNFFSQFILSFFCDLSCDLVILHGIEHVTCVWNIGQTEDLHSSCRTCQTDQR